MRQGCVCPDIYQMHFYDYLILNIKFGDLHNWLLMPVKCVVQMYCKSFFLV